MRSQGVQVKLQRQFKPVANNRRHSELRSVNLIGAEIRHLNIRRPLYLTSLYLASSVYVAQLFIYMSEYLRYSLSAALTLARAKVSLT